MELRDYQLLKKNFACGGGREIDESPKGAKEEKDSLKEKQVKIFGRSLEPENIQMTEKIQMIFEKQDNEKFDGLHLAMYLFRDY